MASRLSSSDCRLSKCEFRGRKFAFAMQRAPRAEMRFLARFKRDQGSRVLQNVNAVSGTLTRRSNKPRSDALAISQRTGVRVRTYGGRVQHASRSDARFKYDCCGPGVECVVDNALTALRSRVAASNSQWHRGLCLRRIVRVGTGREMLTTLPHQIW